MTGPVYRFIGTEHLEEAARIYSDVYVYRLEDSRRHAQRDLEDKGVKLAAAFVDGRLASILQIVDYSIYLNSDRIAMGGIAGIATHAEDRRKHLVEGLLKMALGHMRERGMYTSALYPFSRAFYRKYGWEHVCDALSLKAKVADLHVLRKGVEAAGTARCGFQRVSVDGAGEPGLGALRQIYTSYYSGYNCAVARGDLEWERFSRNIESSIASGTNNYVYLGVRSGTPVSYIAYTFQKNPDDTRSMRIREAAAADGAAWGDLLGFIARHDAQAVEVTGIVPADSPVRVLLAEPGRMEIVPHLMFRIVDVSGFFGAIRTKDEVSGFFTMRVHDRTCEWNDKVFAVSVDGGRASASPALLSDADITLDISALSQIASGYMPAASSARAGLLQVSDARAVSMLQEIFPARATFCADYF